MNHQLVRVLLAVCWTACLTGALAAQDVDNPDLRLLPPVSEEIVAEEIAVGQADASILPPPDATASGTDDPLAITSEPVAWHDWLLPSHWHIPPGWDSSFEIGIDGSEGNATTLSFRTGTNIKRKVDWSDLKIALNYVKATAERRETKHNAQLEMHHDWLIGESRWSPFVKSILVYDEFRPSRLELTLNAGLGYRFVQTDTTTFKGRFGSGASRRFRGSNNTWEPEAMFGVDVEHKFSGRQKVRATVEYYPEWSDFEIYRIRADAGWEMLLDEATNMSLKLGVINRYDTRDSGPRPNALDYTLLLLWKL